MLSDNIKRIRKSKGLSQEELAIKLNVVRQTVSKWENGLSVPDSDMLITLADELDTCLLYTSAVCRRKKHRVLHFPGRENGLWNRCLSCLRMQVERNRRTQSCTQQTDLQRRTGIFVDGGGDLMGTTVDMRVKLAGVCLLYTSSARHRSWNRSQKI